MVSRYKVLTITNTMVAILVVILDLQVNLYDIIGLVMAKTLKLYTKSMTLHGILDMLEHFFYIIHSLVAILSAIVVAILDHQHTKFQFQWHHWVGDGHPPIYLDIKN